MTGRLFLHTVFISLLLSGCGMALSKESRISTEKFGEMLDGREIIKYSILNKPDDVHRQPRIASRDLFQKY
ncbi:hypothetical protein N9D02_11900 [Emcibacteraceae bacterium]|nr:hypothetical protein [Emcibacteraceae bacterium]